MGLLTVRACLSLALACHVVAFIPHDRQVNGMRSPNTTKTTKTTTAMPDFNNAHDNSVAYLVFSVKLNGSILVLCLVAFHVGLRAARTSSLLAPRWEPDARQSSETTPATPAEPGTGIGAREQASAWKDLLQLDLSTYDKNVVKQMSFDGIMLVRFCLLGFKFCAYGSIASAILIPVYATGSGGAEGFQVYSLSNVGTASKRFWLAIVSAWALFALFAKLVIDEWKAFMKLRQEHFFQRAIGSLGDEAAQAQRTLRVELGAAGSEQTEARITAFFENLFGKDSVACCVLQKDTTTVYDVNDALGCILCWSCRPCRPRPSSSGNLVNGIASIILRFIFGHRETMQIPHGGPGFASTAYVTFKKVTDRVVAQQLYLSDDQEESTWEMFHAPEAREIVWPNAAVTLHSRRRRDACFCVVVLFGYLNWSVLVIGIQAWANVGSWTSRSVRKMATYSPLLYDFIYSYLPVVALMLLMFAVPKVLVFVSWRWERAKSKSVLEKRVFRRNFAFQLISLYVIVASTSLFRCLKEFVKQPESALTLTRNQVPASANYFINFVLARTGVTLSMSLLRPWDWLCGDGEKVCCNAWAQAVAQLLVFTLGLTYSFIAPAMLPVCALYFGLASLVYKWLFKNVFTSEFDVAGEVWYDLFEGATVGLFLGALTMTGVAFAFAEINEALTLACAPLPILVACLYWYCRKTYMKAAKFMLLKKAREADLRCEVLYATERAACRLIRVRIEPERYVDRNFRDNLVHQLPQPERDVDRNFHDLLEQQLP